MKGSNVILVIDMLKGFLESGYPLFCGEEARKIIPNVIKLLSENKDNAVLYICDSHSPDDPEFKMFPLHCIKGSDEAELIEELKPYPGVIIPKNRFSAFFKTDLERRLEEIKPEIITVVGVCTDICILYSVADLRARGYNVIVPVSCVSSFDQKGHEWAIQHMDKVLGANIIKTKG